MYIRVKVLIPSRIFKQQFMVTEGRWQQSEHFIANINFTEYHPSYLNRCLRRIKILSLTLHRNAHRTQLLFVQKIRQRGFTFDRTEKTFCTSG